MSRTVLIIDYHSDIADVLALALSMEQYTVKVARRKDEETGYLRNDPTIGCILLDGRSSDLLGDQFIQEVRRLRPDIPVIVLTGDKSVKGQVQETGLRCLTCDPYDIKELESVLESCGSWNVSSTQN